MHGSNKDNVKADAARVAALLRGPHPGYVASVLREAAFLLEAEAEEEPASRRRTTPAFGRGTLRPADSCRVDLRPGWDVE